MKIMVFCSTVGLVFGIASPSPSQQVTSTDQHYWERLDDNAKKRLIDQSADSKQSEPLYAAMHNSDVDVRIYCLGKIEVLPSRQQAELLARILVDDSILWRQGDTRSGGLQGELIQMTIQYKIQTMAFRLLDRNSEPMQRTLTRAEANALADQLRVVR